MSTHSDPKLKAISIKDVENILETNRTITPLGADEEYNSEWFNCEGYSNLNVLLNTDQEGSLIIDYSMDGVVVDYNNEVVISPTDLNGLTSSFGVVSSYMRVNYENGATPQGVFRMSFTFTDKSISGLSITSGAGGNIEVDSNIINNFEVDVLLGKISDQSKNFVFGVNPNISTIPEDIWAVGGTYNWLPAPTTLEILSNDIDDDFGGLGAQVVAILGLDANFDEIVEVVLLNGAVSNPTTQLFLRVNRCVVVQAGTLRGSNFDDLVIRASGGGVVLAVIGGLGASGNFNYGYGISRLGLFTIPNNKRLIIEDLTINISGGKEVNIQAYGLTNPTTLGSAKLLLFTLDSFSGIFRAGKSQFEMIEPRTDIWFSAFTNVSTSAVDLRLYYKLVDVIP